MEEKEESVGVIKWLAVDADGGGIDFGGGVDERLIVGGDEAGFEEGTGLASGTVSEIGEELIETTHVTMQAGMGRRTRRK